MSSKTMTAENRGRWLGAAGVLPFVASAIAMIAFDETVETASRSLVGYGAVILSFLGGVRWGSAIAPGTTIDDVGRGRQLAVSVIPSIVAWIALLMQPAPSLWTLGLGFLALLWLDRRSSREGLFPAWYAGLRLPLTVVAVGSMTLGLAVLGR